MTGGPVTICFNLAVYDPYCKATQETCLKAVGHSQVSGAITEHLALILDSAQELCHVGPKRQT